MLSFVNKILSVVGYTITEQNETKESTNEAHFFISVSMVGPQGCGKTSILEKLKKGDGCSEPLSTLGFDDHTVNVPLVIPFANPLVEPQACLSISEAGGDQKYSNFWKAIMCDTAVVIAVYDCQKEGSFGEALEFIDLQKKSKTWKYTMFVLMASKADRNAKPAVNFKQAKDMADEKGWLFFVVSAKDNTQQDILDKFSRIATACLECWWKEDPDELWASFIEKPFFLYRFIS